MSKQIFFWKISGSLVGFVVRVNWIMDGKVQVGDRRPGLCVESLS